MRPRERTRESLPHLSSGATDSTIAGFAGEEFIGIAHVVAAVQYRALNRKLRG